MKLNREFVTHSTENEHLTVATGKSGFTGMLRSNQTAGFIIEQLKHETTEDEIAAALFAEYDAPEDVIKRDVHAVIEKLRSIGAIDE